MHKCISDSYHYLRVHFLHSNEWKKNQPSFSLVKQIRVRTTSHLMHVSLDTTSFITYWVCVWNFISSHGCTTKRMKCGYTLHATSSILVYFFCGPEWDPIFPTQHGVLYFLMIMFRVFFALGIIFFEISCISNNNNNNNKKKAHDIPRYYDEKKWKKHSNFFCIGLCRIMPIFFTATTLFS